jgi:hypothetical protein
MSPLQMYAAEVARAFEQVAIDLETDVVLDTVQSIADPPGFRIRSHDAHGPLPEMIILEEVDPCATLKNVASAACKLVAMARIRQELSQMLPGLRFMPPSIAKGKAVVGMELGSATISAEVDNFLEGYRKLRKRVMGA